MPEDTVTYLDPTRVTAKRATTPPWNRSRSGYGSKIPSQWLLQLDGKRWHRVYIICYSNSSTAYVRTKQGNLFLGGYDLVREEQRGSPRHPDGGVNAMSNTKKPYVNTFATNRLTAIEESRGWRMCGGGCGCSFDGRKKVPHAHQYPKAARVAVSMNT